MNIKKMKLLKVGDRVYIHYYRQNFYVASVDKTKGVYLTGIGSPIRLFRSWQDAKCLLPERVIDKVAYANCSY